MLVFPFTRGFMSISGTMYKRLQMCSSSVRPVVVLEQGKARLFQDGNPLVYGGAIREIKGDPVSGDDVDVTDHKGNAIGRGFFNPHSQYRVRMIARNHDAVCKGSIEDILTERLQHAVQLRRAVGLPSVRNSAYRLVNGEGDRLGGLIIDVFGNRVIIQSTALWVEIRRELVTRLVQEVMGAESVVLWRQQEARLKQDGFNGTAEASPRLAEENIVVVENSIKFNVNTENSQKTGYYCDQRDNRAMIGAIAAGRSVLDLYCYSAGFSMYAARGGASRVIAVDSSIPALDTAALNAELNGVADRVELVKADVIEYLHGTLMRGEQFDVSAATSCTSSLLSRYCSHIGGNLRSAQASAHAEGPRACHQQVHEDQHCGAAGGQARGTAAHMFLLCRHDTVRRVC